MCGILIVDDDASIRFAMSDYFSAKGLRAHSVASIEEVEPQLASGHYAIVITDLCLTQSGGAEGLEIARMISERHSTTVCIVLTAYGSPDSEATALRYGASAFLHKPRPMAELLDMVSKLLPAGGACAAASTLDAGAGCAGQEPAGESCVTEVFQARDGALSPSASHSLQPMPADRRPRSL